MNWTIHQGDALETLRGLPSESVHCVVTSPPYWGLRDYGHDGQMGLEETPEAYVTGMVEVFREVRRVLRADGTLWLNIGDSYASSTKGSGGTGKSTLGAASGGNGISEAGILRSQKRQAMEARKVACGLPERNLVGIPWRLAFALQADGWYLRQDIIWHKPNPMPESVTDRCTKAHEYLFLLTKGERYYFDHEAIKEDAVRGAAGSSFNTGKTAEHQLGRASTAERMEDGKRNRRDVWTIPTKPFKGAHFAVMPEALVEPCILAGCPSGGTVLDPFTGSGTVGVVARRLARGFVGIELNTKYARMSLRRINAAPMGLDGLAS
jgi:DNA modification methylase